MVHTVNTDSTSSLFWLIMLPGVESTLSLFEDHRKSAMARVCCCRSSCTLYSVQIKNIAAAKASWCTIVKKMAAAEGPVKVYNRTSVAAAEAPYMCISMKKKMVELLYKCTKIGTNT